MLKCHFTNLLMVFQAGTIPHEAQAELWVLYVYSVLLILALLLALGTVLFGLYWLPRRWYRAPTDAKGAPTVRIFAASFAASLAFFVMIGMIMYVLVGQAHVGVFTIASLGFTVSTYLFLILAVLSLLAAIWSFWVDVSALIRWHSLLVSVSLTAIAVLLAFWGIIGARVWMW